MVCQSISGDRVSRVPAGICVGREYEQGRCVCAKDHWCDDCSLHTIDLVSGLGFWSVMNESTGRTKPVLRCNMHQRGGGDCLGSKAEERMVEMEKEKGWISRWQYSDIQEKWFWQGSDTTAPPTPPPKWLAATVAP